MRKRTFWLLLVALAAVRLFLMATVPVFEPSEARYAAISANMARSGDFVVPRFTHDLEYQSFDGKPPLVFQAGGLSCAAFGICEFAVRLFPFLSAVLLLLILHHAVKRFSDAETARLSVLVCASCTAFYAAAGIALTDITLTCCVSGALLLYWCFLDGFAIGYSAGIAALLGAGMITKGPVALVMFGLPVLVDAIVNRRWRGIFNVKWLVVAPLFLLIALPWFLLVEQRNPGAVWYFFYNENFLRFVSHEYGDKYGAGREAFRGVSILWALVVMLPWPMFLFGRFWKVFRREGVKGVLLRVLRSRNLKTFDFISLAVVSIVGFWCLTSRVLIYYLFPVVPLVAVTIALNVDRRLLSRVAPWGAAISVAVVAGGLTCGMLWSDRMLGDRTEFSQYENHYAFEFYHGRMSETELSKFRAKRQAFIDSVLKQAEAK